MGFSEFIEGIKSVVAYVINGLSVIANGIKTIVNVIADVAVKLGLMDSNVDMDELGAKALIAQEDGIEVGEGDIESYDEAYKIVNSMELDTARAEKYSPDDRYHAAAELVTGLLVQKHPGIESILSLLNNNGTLNESLTSDRIAQYAKLGLSFEDVASFWKGELVNNQKIAEVENGMQKAEKNIAPDLSDKEISNITNNQFGSV